MNNAWNDIMVDGFPVPLRPVELEMENGMVTPPVMLGGDVCSLSWCTRDDGGGLWIYTPSAMPKRWRYITVHQDQQKSI